MAESTVPATVEHDPTPRPCGAPASCPIDRRTHGDAAGDILFDRLAARVVEARHERVRLPDITVVLSTKVLKAGTAIAANMPPTTSVTNNSMSVNPGVGRITAHEREIADSLTRW